MLHTKALKNSILALGILILSGSAFAAPSSSHEFGTCLPGMDCYTAAISKSKLDELRDIQNSGDMQNYQIYYKDDQVQKARSQELGSIGMIISPNTKSRGTAFLVDQCHVLTAQHVESSKPQMANPAPRLHFFFGQGNYKGFEKPVTGTVVRQGGYDERLQNNANDWMLIKLDECVGARVGYARIKPESRTRPDEKALKIAGFPAGKEFDSGLWVDPTCSIKRERAGAWLHDCASDRGSSGAPLFYVTRQGTKSVVNVVGLHVYGVHANLTATWQADNSNIAAQMDSIYEAIKNDINP